MTNKHHAWRGVKPAEYRDLIRAVARTDGWQVTVTRGSTHIKVTSPTGESRQFPLTSSSYRGRRNTLADLKRMGWRP